MDSFSGFASLADAALLVGLSSTRIAVAFLLLPVFAPDTIPAMVRNAICIALAVLVLALQGAVSPHSWTSLQWLALFGKEAALGIALGFGMAAFLWAFSAAGQIVDTKVGVSNAQLTDPMSGQSVSLSGALLGRLAGFLFMSGGGFLLYAGALIESFRAWPLGLIGFAPQMTGMAMFEHHFSDLMALSFLLAAPALVIMFAVDLVLGLINRFAPQLNVSAVSASVKGLASTAVWMLMLSTVVHGFNTAFAQRIAPLLQEVGRVMGARSFL